MTVTLRVTDHTGTALNVIRDRIRESPRYRSERQHVVEYVARQIKNKTVEEMRSAGGFTTIIKHGITHFASDANMGTAMIPWTHRNEMATDLNDIRNDAVRLNNSNT